jgi:hypothetical protein
MQRTSTYSSFIHFINTFSIWVVLGSFSSHLFFCKIYGVEPNYIIATGLAVGVWVIYTLDHLLDGIALKNKAVTRRHKEHFFKRGIIKKLLIIATVLLAVLSYWVPANYYIIVGLLLLLTALHFTVNYLVPSRIKKLFFLKEVFVAIIVTIGIAATSLVGDLKAHESLNSFSFWVFLFINLANIILFSYFDKEDDKKSETLSIAGIYADHTLKGVIYTSLLLSITLSSWDFFTHQIEVESFIIFGIMQLTLAIICVYSRYFSKNDRYRFWGDLIYVYPLIALPFL